MPGPAALPKLFSPLDGLFMKGFQLLEVSLCLLQLWPDLRWNDFSCPEFPVATGIKIAQSTEFAALSSLDLRY